MPGIDALGIDRAVIVQGSANGANHAVTLDAIARSEGRFRASASSGPKRPWKTSTPWRIPALRLRVSATAPGGLRPAHVEPMTAKAKELGWLVEIHLRNIDELLPLISWIEKANVPVLIDHLGRPRGGRASIETPFRRFAMLRDTDHVWAKICSWYRLSDSGPPYEDMRPFVEALIAARPDRLVGHQLAAPEYYDPDAE